MPKAKPLKILFLCSWYPNRTNKTLGNFIQKHAESISRIHKVEILSLVSDENINFYDCVEKKHKGIREIIVYYPKSKTRIPIIKHLSKIFRQYKAFKSGWEKVIETQKPSITHVNVAYPIGLWAVYLKKMKKIPYVLTEHSSGFHSKENGYSKMTLKICKLILRNASYIMPVSDDLKSHLVKLHPNGKYQAISNVVDKEVFKIGSSNSQKKQFIHVSTAYEPAKNVLGIINVIKKLSLQRSDFNIHIISDGDTKKAHELARELGVLNSYIIFHETKTTLEIAKMYQGKKALVLFSNFENFPCVIAEAWMSGVPVIATKVNGIPEYLSNKNGVLIDPKNEQMLLDSLNKILNNEIEFDENEMRTFALKHFSYESISEKYNEIYRKVISV